MTLYSEMLWKYRVAAVSPDPRRALRDMVLRQFAETEDDRSRILNDLEHLRIELREEGQDEGIVLDVMSTLAGWVPCMDTVQNPNDESVAPRARLNALGDDAVLPTTAETAADLRRIRSELRRLWSDGESLLRTSTGGAIRTLRADSRSTPAG
jgi:hypothetical protein